MLNRVAILVAIIPHFASFQVAHADIWIGTAPFCAGSPNDCTSRGLAYVRSDERGDGSRCLRGKKVLCAPPPPALVNDPVVESRWFGTAPFCAGDPLDCSSRGMHFVRADASGDGARCVTGTKVLCERTASAKPITLRSVWVGTAPLCHGLPSDCGQRGMQYVRSHSSGDGEACVLGEKVLCQCEAPAYSRPSYVIAHRCNSVEDAQKALSDGANAVEFDVQYSVKDQAFCVSHGAVDGCEGNRLDDYLRGLRSLAERYGDQFALVYFDIKDVGTASGGQLAELARRELTRLTDIKTIFSVSSFAKTAVLDTITPMPGEALAIDEEADVERVAGYFRNRNVSRCAYGHGTFVAGVDLNITESVRKAILLQQSGAFQFVHVWTLANEGSIGRFLGYGVNGILVNDPRKMTGVIDTWCIPARVATRSDNPFP